MDLARVISPGNDEPDSGGFRFRMTVSLGNLIHIAVLLGMGIMAWTTLQDRQQVYERSTAEQQREIVELVKRQEFSAELNARQAAIIDGLEKRITRMEYVLDKR